MFTSDIVDTFWPHTLWKPCFSKVSLLSHKFHLQTQWHWKHHIYGSLSVHFQESWSSSCISKLFWESSSVAVPVFQFRAKKPPAFPLALDMQWRSQFSWLVVGFACVVVRNHARVLRGNFLQTTNTCIPVEKAESATQEAIPARSITVVLTPRNARWYEMETPITPGEAVQVQVRHNATAQLCMHQGRKEKIATFTQNARVPPQIIIHELDANSLAF